MAQSTASGESEAAVKTQQATAPASDMFAKAKYHRVIFDAKSDPMAPNDVVLSNQGFVVKCQRNVETIVPDFILGVANDATYSKYRIVPGEGRKVEAKIRKYPYRIVGDASLAEFKNLFAQGTKKTRAAVAAHGLQVPAEKTQPQED
jgi:hypothetical protein